MLNVLSTRKPFLIFCLSCAVIILDILGSTRSYAALPDTVKAVYLPPHCFTERKVSEVSHYARLAGLNAAVLHVKDPHGWIRWNSGNRLAREMGAIATNGRVEKALRQLKEQGFWCIAKLDVFVDHRLVRNNPYMGILDVRTAGPWQDKNGLYWANPYNSMVWEYNLALCRELVELGFDEIQFDYIRFPSDGDLSSIHYPVKPDGLSRTACIGKFLETARKQLKPADITLSVDLFGLVAWKTEDFGVGQKIEAIAPNVDVICPMFYPSHFPKGFLGHNNPGEKPLEIMELSTKRLQERTGKRIRPWIQGFWYSPEQINAQIDGLQKAGTGSWSVWNPTGNYAATYAAIEIRTNQDFPEPKFYPSLTEICKKNDRVLPGNSKIINLTNYKKGYSIISLEASANGIAKSYSTLIQVLGTLDEGIMDRILELRDIPFTRLTGKYKKKLRLAELLCQDLQIDPRMLRPTPIYIDWQHDCRFTRTIPVDRLSTYHNAGKAAFAKGQDIFAKFPKPRS